MVLMLLVGDCRRDAADHNAGELTKAHKLARAGTRRAQEHGLVCAANLAAFFTLDHCLIIYKGKVYN